MVAKDDGQVTRHRATAGRRRDGIKTPVLGRSRELPLPLITATRETKMGRKTGFVKLKIDRIVPKPPCSGLTWCL
jgi:hypothetical protein